jgi:uncharacterized protein (TIRG00374 family)
MKWVYRVTFVLGLLLLAGLLWKLGPMALFSELGHLGWIWGPLLFLEGIGEAFHALGWRKCLSRGQQRMPWIKIAMIRQAGMAFNYLTPTAHMGGELVKGALLGREGDGTEAATAVAVGKLALASSQIGFVVAGSLVSLILLDVPGRLMLGWSIGTLFFASGILTFFVLQRQGKLGVVVRALSRSRFGGRSISKLDGFVSGVDQQLRAFHRDRPGDFIGAMVFHAIGFSCGIFQTWIFLTAIGFENPWSMGIMVWFVGAWFDLIAFIVPAGLGIQEGSRVLIFHELGFRSLSGLTYGLVLRVLKLFWAVVGLGCYALLLRIPGHPTPLSE